MNKILLTFMFIIFSTCAFAQNFEPPKPPIPTTKERKEFDKMLDERLHLTDEQKKIISSERKKHIKEMQSTISKMEELHKKIKNVYMLGIPKYQADIRTAGYKTELAILKQNAEKQKQEYRKNFENNLNKEQKIEFEKIKNERMQKRIQERKI